MKKIYVLDTNILMDTAGTAINGFDDNDVVITGTTIMELEKHKNDEGETGFNVREASRIIKSLRERGNLYQGVALDFGGTFRIEENGVEHELPEWMLIESKTEKDNRILASTLSLIEKNPDMRVVLVTNDGLMQIRADALGIETQEYKNDSIATDDLYAGRRLLSLSVEHMNQLYKNGSLLISELTEFELDGLDPSGFLENEFLQIMALENNQSALAWVKNDEIVLLDGDVINAEYMGLTARNAGQRFMIAALNEPADKIPLVIVYGPAGTGKTLVAEAVGLSKTYGGEFKSRNAEYQNVYITRSNTLPENENLGYLKGDLEEKMGPLLAPFYDNLETLLKMSGDESPEQIEMMFEDLVREGGPVKIISLAYIRGRSIPESYIIIDEAQNLTAKQVKTIITRAGMNTKIVLLGDPEQIDAPRLSKKMNGLVYAAEKLKGQKLTAVVTMTEEECMRSDLAKVAEKLL